jgi:hypothetical protein
MAIVIHDDFENPPYPPGTSLPFGYWTAAGIVFTAMVTTGGVQNSQCFDVFGPVAWSNASTNIDFTLRFEYRTPQPANNVVQIYSTIGQAVPIQLFFFNLNQDGTVSVPLLPAGKTSPNNQSVSFPNWNSFQLEVVISVVGGAVQFDFELYVNDQLALSGTVVPVLPAGTLPASVTADTFIINGSVIGTAQYDEWLIISPHAGHPIHDAVMGTPAIRVSQAMIEVAEIPDQEDNNARITQGVVEVAELPSDAEVRVSEGVIEIVFVPDTQWHVAEA